jgi:hypothetical protein
MKGPELLKHYEDNWETEMGAWFPGERVVIRGLDLFSEFEKSSWMEYLLFAVTGKRDAALARFIEGLWTFSTSYPDPRLWNNRIAALGGTVKTTGVLAVSAGIAASEATIYGLKPIVGAYKFLGEALQHMSSDAGLEEFVLSELKKNKSLYGYGRPLIPRDERVEPVISLAKKHGFDRGDYLKAAFAIEEVLDKRKKIKMNIAAVNAALMADAGLTIDEYYCMATLSFSAGMFPALIDAQRSKVGTFFPMSVTSVRYSGALERGW